MAETAREALFAEIRRGIEYAVLRSAGTGGHGDYARNADAWRSAPLPALLDSVMTHIRAGIDPWLSRQAVEDGTAVARRILDQERAKGVDQ